jgi:hypothetical protein
MQFHSFARRRNEITPRATGRIIRKLKRTVQLYRTLYFCVSSKEFIVLAVAVGSASGTRRRSVVLQPDRRLGIDDVYVHNPRNQHHCYRIQRRQFICQAFHPDEPGTGLAGDPSGDHEIFAKWVGRKTLSSLICWV